VGSLFSLFLWVLSRLSGSQAFRLSVSTETHLYLSFFFLEGLPKPNGTTLCSLEDLLRYRPPPSRGTQEH